MLINASFLFFLALSYRRLIHKDHIFSIYFLLSSGSTSTVYLVSFLCTAFCLGSQLLWSLYLGLTCGMFLKDNVQVACPDKAAGLYVKNRNDEVVKVFFQILRFLFLLDAKLFNYYLWLCFVICLFEMLLNQSS